MSEYDFGRFADAIPAPNTLHIRMTRGERRIADGLRKHFGGFERVIIDVDGERHEFGADSLIRLFEDYEDAQGMNNHKLLFGTPERAARTLLNNCEAHHYRQEARQVCEGCPADGEDHDCDYDALLEWLRGDEE